MKDCKSKTSMNIVGKNLARIVRDLRLKVPCKNRDTGCTHQCMEDEIELHEDECKDRKVKCDYKGCEIFPFKDLLNHFRDVHKVDCDAKKWIMDDPLLEKDEPVRYKIAFMFEIGPDGLDCLI